MTSSRRGISQAVGVRVGVTYVRYTGYNNRSSTGSRRVYEKELTDAIKPLLQERALFFRRQRASLTSYQRGNERVCRGGRETTPGKAVSASVHTECINYVGVITRLSDGIYRVLYLPIVFMCDNHSAYFVPKTCPPQYLPNVFFLSQTGGGTY